MNLDYIIMAVALALVAGGVWWCLKGMDDTDG